MKTENLTEVVRNFALALLLVLFCAAVPAQTAKVIALSPSDAAEAKSLYDQQEALTKRTADFREGIKKKYLTTDAKSDYALDESVFAWRNNHLVPLLYFKQGWGDGVFEYSEDFKYIVPNTPLITSGSRLTTCGNWVTGTNLNTLTPAVGIFN